MTNGMEKFSFLTAAPHPELNACIIIFDLKCVNSKPQRIDVMERVVLATATVSMKAPPFEKEPFINACQFRDFL